MSNIKACVRSHLLSALFDRKMRGLVILLLAVAAVSALPRQSRIVGGELTTINQYPDMAVLMVDRHGSGIFAQNCGGVIINNRSIMTAAHCFNTFPGAWRWRIRIGSTYSNTGGVLLRIIQIINHRLYNRQTSNNDIAIVRIQGEIIATDVIKYAAIGGYDVPDNAVVWAAGWGRTSSNGPSSVQLRHVQIYTINLDVCRQRFSTLRMSLTDNMLCSGILDVGGRDQCFGDSGGPLYHNGVVVGVCSFGPPNICADSRWPGVNTRVQRYTQWLADNR